MVLFHASSEIVSNVRKYQNMGVSSLHSNQHPAQLHAQHPAPPPSPQELLSSARLNRRTHLSLDEAPPEDPLLQICVTDNENSREEGEEPNEILGARRITVSPLASSEIVMSLFGESVGPCWGDFSCSYYGIRGRLYATSQAILFYTNLLGFERRICLLIRDVAELGLYRTTSIRIHMADLEIYIFKSFNDREKVLHLLNGLKILSDRAQQKLQNRTTQDGSELIVQSKPFHNSLHEMPGGNGDPLLNNNNNNNDTNNSDQSNITNANRRRAASDSVVRIQIDDNRQRLETIPSLSEEDMQSNAPEDSRQHVELSPHRGQSLDDIWDTIKTPNNPPLSQLVLDNMIIPCSVEDYFKTFLADDAQYSLDFFQREYVKDKNVEITGWDVGTEGAQVRTISFLHPIPNSMGIGPTAALTKSQQTLKKFDKIGCMALDSKSFVEGVPGADCFYVQDLWVFEPIPFKNQMDEKQPKSIKLSIHYDVVFKKRSLLRSIILRSVKKEKKEWIAEYMDMVLSVLAARAQEENGEQQQLEAKQPRLGSHPSSSLDDHVAQLLVGMDRTNRIIAWLLVLVILCVLFFSYQLWSMHQCMLDIRADLQAIVPAIQQHL